ncbi:MAG TPA: alpha-amylase family glycosyl hydrolase, partial [Gaiellaceae bacterium]|nr:alpha-amylase family glycosyl hydrolase [Gaiellaceae bacterium]
MTSAEWWRSAVFYEIYVRSFADSDGDGVGDLQGVRSRLPYLRRLGVDAVWLTPFYPSPGVDHGYDVANYVDVDPLFGSLDDFDALLTDAHALGLRVIVDIVPNHTSIEHPWFRERPELYVWADEVPNNWPSVFGGPAWSRDEAGGRYYLHLFAPEQPDLDWHNHQVGAEFERILRFWLERGVDGFRIDVAWGLFKDPELRDEPEPFPDAVYSSDWRAATDRPELHPLYRDWRRMVDAYPGDRVLVAEAMFSDPRRVAPYVAPDELHLAFNFTLLLEPWDVQRIRAAIEASLAAFAPLGATTTWVLESHDVTRLPTRYGSLRRARAAALLLLALPGAAFLYQGQELGLEEVDLPDELRQDPIFRRTGGARPGRDGCRVPIPWTTDPPAFGFTSGAPWLPMPPDWGPRSAAAQDGDPASMLELVRNALEARPNGPFEWRDSDAGTIAFSRGTVVCIVNVGGEAVLLPPGELVLASEPLGST